MKLRIKLLACFLLSISLYSYGQIGQYNYIHELKGISEQWHTIELPDELFAHSKQNLSDIRIYGITAEKDTLETPYRLRLSKAHDSRKDVRFKVINRTRNNEGYFFTFEIPTQETINHLEMVFVQQNFDWQIRLEGSHNQREWFTLTEDYRILSIKNQFTDFSFTKINFPESKFRYLRLFIDSRETPELTMVHITQNEHTNGAFKTFPIQKIKRKELKKTKQSEIDIYLTRPVAVSRIQLEVGDSINFYRNMTVKYLTDSIKTEKGWHYQYQTLTRGVLNSIEENKFKFKSTTAQQLKILIDNRDNRPLKIDTITVSGYKHNIDVLLRTPARYFLVYGNKQATKPSYDIERFTDNIPAMLKPLKLGDAQQVKKKDRPHREPLFKNKNWLWAIIVLIIVTLGWFSVKMMKTKE